jgi:hypothetical protein
MHGSPDLDPFVRCMDPPDPGPHQNVIDPEHHLPKDWPPDGDIAEYIPRRFHNLVNDFPIGAYTLREGPLNLASYMPEYLLRPELGPKMYIAYGKLFSVSCGCYLVLFVFPRYRRFRVP